VYSVNVIRQIEMYRSEPLVPELSPFSVEMATEKPKNVNYHVLMKFWQN
jgi:hypothetical protein